MAYGRANGQAAPIREEPTVRARTALDQDSLPGEGGLDLLEEGLTLLRGWKLIVAVTVAAGVAGLAFVAQTPRDYRATAMLQVVAESERPPSGLLGAMQSAEAKVQAALPILQHYAEILLADENLRQAAGEARLDHPTESTADLTKLRAAVRAIPSEDLSGVELSVTLRDATQTERFLEALVQRGVKSIEADRDQGIDAMARQLVAEQNEALAKYCSKQEEVETLRRQKGFNERQAELSELEWRLATTRYSVSDLKRAIRDLETRIAATREMLDRATSGQIGEQGSNRLSELHSRLALELNMSPSVLHEWEAEFGSENLVVGWLKWSLARDRAALRTAQQEIQQSQETIPSLLEEIANSRTQFAGLQNDLRFAEWDLTRSQEDYLASVRAVEGWKRNSHQRLPALARAKVDSTEDTVRPVGTSDSARMMLILLGAFGLGCVVVLVRESFRRRAGMERCVGAVTQSVPAPHAAASKQECVSA